MIRIETRRGHDEQQPGSARRASTPPIVQAGLIAAALGSILTAALVFAAALFVSIMVLAPAAALADEHSADETGVVGTDASAMPPPGSLGAEGIVPKEGFAAEGSSEDVAARSVEPIGHVPRADEGVYGDPPNTGGSVDPETRGWAYDEGYFFALTRGLETDTELSDGGRRWVRPLTITFDVVTLPTAAIAGLWGKPPVEDSDAGDGDGDAEPAEEAASAAHQPAADQNPA